MTALKSTLLLALALGLACAAATQVIAHVGKVRMLFVLERFQGWERGADWGDMRFFDTFGQNVERIAIVGEEKWRDQTRMFLLADMREAPVRFFTTVRNRAGPRLVVAVIARPRGRAITSVER